jgi:predicted ATPase
VLYFEPEGGQTYIHELRIDSAGEFIDKWPRGFFEERYEDLFDEPRMGD